MNKKEVNEIRRILEKNDCRIDRMCGCYIDEKGELITELTDSFHSLADEELFRYCEIFRKTLSGRIGRTLLNLSFPLQEEKEGGRAEKLQALLRSGLQDPERIRSFFGEVTETLRMSEKYLLLLAHGIYDIPGRTTDGAALRDSSDYVYSFLLLSVCPVKLLRDGLCYDSEEQTFLSRTENWGVQMPETGFLYPAFNDRSTDLHAALWYAKNEKSRHEELAAGLLGIELPRGESAERDVFREIVEQSLGADCSYESVRNVNDAVNKIVEEEKEAGEQAYLDGGSLAAILTESGAAPEAAERARETYQKVVGSGAEPILADNVAAPKTLSVKSDHMKLEVLSEASELIETREIDGMEYFLIPVADNVTVNGIRIRRRRGSGENAGEKAAE